MLFPQSSVRVSESVRGTRGARESTGGYIQSRSEFASGADVRADEADETLYPEQPKRGAQHAVAESATRVRAFTSANRHEDCGSASGAGE